ncbi:MAG TPA: alanine--tRNA ligase-related protein, partial [Elusimicrobiota bacterium]|nr:alanine--tRNA ligase-related protein [Elusimicrobiota bacterium]
ELAKARTEIQDTLRAEEERFLATLENGERRLEELLSKGAALTGEQAFQLYETFGFPFELTQEICRKRGVAVDAESFRTAQEGAAETARAGWKGSGETSQAAYEKVAAELPGFKAEFHGYQKISIKTQVARLLKDGHAVQTLAPGDEGEVVLRSTPFYPEGGGQVGDQGRLCDDVDPEKTIAEVKDTQRPHPNLIVHSVRALKTLRADMPLWAKVDPEKRRTTAYHHTATHLLNEALRRVLGAGVRQAGSLVAPDRLRFDFTHPKPMTQEELAKVEAIVNEAIQSDIPVHPEERPAADIAALGATTLLGENYGAKPRFLLIGKTGWKDPQDRFSLELCGGTHVSRTGEIQSFKIVKETSVAAGIRRIEAVAGPALEQLERQQEDKDRQALKDGLQRYIELTSLIQTLSGKPYKDVIQKFPDAASAPITDVRRALGGLRELEKILKSEIGGLKEAKLAHEAKMGQVLLEVGGVKLSVQKFESAEAQTLRTISDQVKREMGTGVVFLGATAENRLSFVVSVTQDLVEKGVDASAIARQVAAIQKGKAGGRKDFAQGGGPDADWETVVNAVKGSLRG